MTPDGPRVSVLVAAYNVGEYIAEAVESTLAQTYGNLETVVVDDGSTDDTRQVLERFGDRIILVTQENRGPAAARNAALRVATGEVIGILDGDDVWSPERAARCVAVLREHPAVGFVTTDAALIDPSGQSLGESYCDQVPFPTTRLHEAMARQNVVYGSPFVWRHIFDEVGPYDEALVLGAEDYDMWLRFVLHGVGMHTIPEELAQYRIRSSSLTRQRGGLVQPTTSVLERHLPAFWRQGVYGSSNEAIRIAINLGGRGEWRRAARFAGAAFRDPERNVCAVLGAAARGTYRAMRARAGRRRCDR